VKIILILSQSKQSLVSLFLQSKKNSLWENLGGRNNQQETNPVLGSSETLRGTFFFAPFGLTDIVRYMDFVSYNFYTIKCIFDLF